MSEKEKATAEQTKRCVKQISELDKLADKDPAKFTDWELNFVDEQADRVDEFADKTYFSIKQVEIVDRIYRKIVLCEDVGGGGDDKPVKKRGCPEFCVNGVWVNGLASALQIGW